MAQSKLNPYLNFIDQTRDAMEFYKSVFGGDLVLNTFKDSGMPQEGDGIMHSQLETPSGFTLMASDKPSHMEVTPGKIGTISLSGDNEEELKGYWEKLSEGAKTTMPLEKAPWGDTFGMLTDKFGVEWMVNIAGKKE